MNNLKQYSRRVLTEFTEFYQIGTNFAAKVYPKFNKMSPKPPRYDHSPVTP